MQKAFTDWVQQYFQGSSTVIWSSQHCLLNFFFSRENRPQSHLELPYCLWPQDNVGAIDVKEFQADGTQPIHFSGAILSNPDLYSGSLVHIFFFCFLSHLQVKGEFERLTTLPGVIQLRVASEIECRSDFRACSLSSHSVLTAVSEVSGGSWSCTH